MNVCTCMHIYIYMLYIGLASKVCATVAGPQCFKGQWIWDFSNSQTFVARETLCVRSRAQDDS